MKKSLNLWGVITILTLSLGFTACGDDDDEPVDKKESTTQYVWGTDGGLKSCDHLLFTNGKEDPHGKEIGNGNQEFVFKLSLIHISEPTRPRFGSRMPSSA